MFKRIDTDTGEAVGEFYRPSLKEGRDRQSNLHTLQLVRKSMK
jgi:hypothetical protein